MAQVSKYDPKKIYVNLKKNATSYDEEEHCTLLLKILGDTDKGTVSAFCVEAFITDSTFYRWLNKYPIFYTCYRYGLMQARENWEAEGRLGKDDESFNLEYWRIIGASRFGVGKTNRVRLEVDSDTNPYDQYRQIMLQASNGDFTAGELKQIMESVNVGRGVFETFELQKEVSQMKEDLLKMEQNHGNNSGSIAKT
jgi:hypothetical protein